MGRLDSGVTLDSEHWIAMPWVVGLGLFEDKNIFGSSETSKINNFRREWDQDMKHNYYTIICKFVLVVTVGKSQKWK